MTTRFGGRDAARAGIAASDRAAGLADSDERPVPPGRTAARSAERVTDRVARSKGLEYHGGLVG